MDETTTDYDKGLESAGGAAPQEQMNEENRIQIIIPRQYGGAFFEVHNIEFIDVLIDNLKKARIILVGVREATGYSESLAQLPAYEDVPTVASSNAGDQPITVD